MLLDRISSEKKEVCSKDQLIPLLAEREGMEVVVTFGAGDIDALVPEIKQLFKKRKL